MFIALQGICTSSASNLVEDSFNVSQPSIRYVRNKINIKTCEGIRKAIKRNFFGSEEIVDQTGIDRMKQINKLIYRLAKDDDLSEVSPSQDPCLLDEWHINLFARVREVQDVMWVFFNT